MSPDIASLNLQELEPIDYDNYQDGGSGGKDYAPPPEGRYVGTLPQITDTSFSATQAGALKCSLDPITIVGPVGGGSAGKDYAVRFASVSAKKYSNREGSQAIDLLRACGLAARPSSNTELMAALKAASGRTVQFGLQWEAYNKETQESTKGEESFPLMADGKTRQPWIVDPGDDKKRIFANGKVRFFISAIAK